MICIKRLFKSPFFYFVVVLILVIGMAIAVINVQLWSYLDDYEKSTPKYYMDNFLKKMQTGDYSGLMESLSVDENKFLTEDDYITYLNEIFGDEPQNIMLFDGSEVDGNHKYQVALDGNEGIDLILSKNGNSYSLEQVNLPENELQIFAPENVKVYANDVELTNENRINGLKDIDSFSVATDKLIVPKISSYKIDGFLCEPVITAKGSGSDNVVISKEKSGVHINVTSSGEEKTNIETFAMEASVVCANFISKDASIGAYSKYLLKDSDYYKSLSSYSNYWYIDHDKPVVENLKCESVYKHSDNTFTAVVSFLYKVETRNDKGHFKREFPTKYSISIVEVDGKYKIVNLLSL